MAREYNFKSVQNLCFTDDFMFGAELKAFLGFLRDNEAESDFTREIENMVQTKKFEQSLINEYLAINLHEQDVERRAKELGRLEGKMIAYIDLIKDGLLSEKEALQAKL